jgi:hypothetical protein
MNTPNLPEKKESFTPLSLPELMKLKEEIFEIACDYLQDKDNILANKCIEVIADYSLDDAWELCCRM